MREILFRGKTKWREWIYGDLITRGIDFDDAIKQHHTREVWDIIPETVGQFTGLTDKNGKKIFEGDIVELYDKNSNVRWKAVVVFGNPYGEYSWGWNLKYISKNPRINTDILCWVEMEETGAFCETIGNIHDNPELLEVE